MCVRGFSKNLCNGFEWMRENLWVEENKTINLCKNIWVKERKTVKCND